MEIFEVMHILDCAQQLNHYIAHDVFCHFYAIDKIEQVSSFAKLGNYIKDSLIVIYVVKLDDVGVVHLIQDLKLIYQVHFFLLVQGFLFNHLNCTQFVSFSLSSLEYRSETAFAYLLNDLIICSDWGRLHFHEFFQIDLQHFERGSFNFHPCEDLKDRLEHSIFESSKYIIHLNRFFLGRSPTFLRLKLHIKTFLLRLHQYIPGCSDHSLELSIYPYRQVCWFLIFNIFSRVARGFVFKFGRRKFGVCFWLTKALVAHLQKDYNLEFQILIKTWINASTFLVKSLKIRGQRRNILSFSIEQFVNFKKYAQYQISSSKAEENKTVNKLIIRVLSSHWWSKDHAIKTTKLIYTLLSFFQKYYLIFLCSIVIISIQSSNNANSHKLKLKIITKTYGILPNPINYRGQPDVHFPYSNYQIRSKSKMRTPLFISIPYAYNFYQDIIIMKNGKLTGGLYIEDDEAKPAYEHQTLDANRKKGNFEKDLDAMLFGGFGAPPPRRRPAAETKPAEQGKPAEQPKPTDPKPQPSTNVPTVPANQPKPVQPVVNPPTDAGKTKPGSGDVNKSTDSGKNINQNQGGKEGTVVISGGAKVVINNPGQHGGLNTKKQPSILVPQNDPIPPVNNIPIESQPVLPPKKVDNYVNPKQPEKKPEVNPNIPAQPSQSDEVITIDKLHPFSHKINFNKPGNIRKGKKVAEDFKFAQENVTQNNAVDVVRPFEVDRTRQRKLNDFNFKDFEFPSSSVSLGGEHATKESVWKAQASLAKTVCFGKYVDPNDVNPGLLSNPHFVSTLSAISEFEANTKRLIEDQKVNGNGFYLIRLFVNSVWRYIAVDSTLPFVDNENAGVFSNPDNEFELAPALIEKAYAKVFGGYDTFSRIQPRQNYLRDLTGAPVKKYSIENPDLASIVKKALTTGQIVLVVPNQRIATVGLNPNNSYPLINYTAKGSMEMRNSFGTLQQRSKISFRPEGTFELGSGQVRDFISHILVTNINTANFTSTIQSKHRNGFYSSYNFKVRNNTQGFLTVSQWDERLFPVNSHYEYSPFHIILHRNEDGHSTFVNAAFTPGSRNLDLEVNLTPGQYTVFVAANWKHTEYSYNLTFYGSERVDFERVYTSKLPNLISQSLEALNVENGRRTDINKNSAQYLYYQHESNLIILTVENTTDRDGTVTADLSKVKFDHLLLLTSHNNEEDYNNKVGGEIDEYKQAPISDRRWSVSLAGRQRFTWVLAADEPYNDTNPKKWGFA